MATRCVNDVIEIQRGLRIGADKGFLWTAMGFLSTDDWLEIGERFVRS